MSEKVNPNPNQAPTHDAQLAAENMVTGNEQVPAVDTEADYEASKAFSVSKIDRTGEGSQAATAATAPKLEVPKPQESAPKADTTGNPDDYLNMARDVNPAAGSGENVDDEIVQKALKKGEAGK
ncbi:hypothetical protein NIES2119_19945 [[Phormidium ambiguum] IAM M-71]|uniref:Uncharacterized protein n=1 Tax=[Phormidium ambiguum] IAM M-71 TaxID=454136 RepID=A0A1U7IEU8_9CYAN|nr:hypothetical protein [Phormidium ambiguum]OKH35531.1 hypothetical protein NIES2119_19945 [Phormidium ambiguum IAM M-71]